MNKYILILIFGIVVIGGGVLYKNVLISDEKKPIDTGIIKRITITTGKNQWKFFPENLEVNQGDNIIATIINEDDYDHGIAIDAFGISQRMPANSTIIIKFVATQPGNFIFYCSVPCGEGDVGDEHRDHFDMIGHLKVQKIFLPKEEPINRYE